MLARTAKWCCLIGMWLLAPIAAAATGNQLFKQGVVAFKTGDFVSAVRYFQQARRAGLDLPTLYYNLGASLYKLGRYAEAEEAFRACARDPIWAALANYNAGLAAYQRGQRAAAAEYFEHARLTADSDEVRALALAMLERTDVAASRRPRGALALDLGYNDNVTFAADNQILQTSSEPDRFSELAASVTGGLGPSSLSLRWGASLDDLRYARLTDNNITSVALGVSKSSRTAPSYATAGVQWEYALRDGHRFQQIASLRLTGVRDRPGHGDLRLSFQASTIDALDDNFAFLDGSRQELDASAAERLGGGQIRLGTTLERNQRADLTTSGEFFSFSPIRSSVWLVGSWSPTGYWRFEPIARYSHSRYADPDRRTSGVVATREDNERQLTLRAMYRLTPVWRLRGEFTYVDNESNFSEFSYSQRIVSLGVTRPF